MPTWPALNYQDNHPHDTMVTSSSPSFPPKSTWWGHEDERQIEIMAPEGAPPQQWKAQILSICVEFHEINPTKFKSVVQISEKSPQYLIQSM